MNKSKDQKKSRKKFCSLCGRKLWLNEFYLLKNGSRHSWCRECTLKRRKDKYISLRKVPDGIFLHKKLGRIVEHNGCSTRIFWNENMLSMMRRYFHNTTNREMSEMIGVSESTIHRKAREMNLKKDKDFISQMNKEKSILASSKIKQLGIKRGFANGMKFKGNQYTGRVRIK